jgi:hypothetical protein
MQQDDRLGFYTDSQCNNQVNQTTTDAIYDLPLNRQLFSKENDGSCLSVTKKGPNFVQSVIQTAVGCSSNKTLCKQVNTVGGEVCMQGVSNSGQMMACMLMNSSVPKNDDLKSLTTKIDVNCNDPSTQCKMQ